MTESRSRTRGRTLKGAKAVFNKRASVLDCVIRDMSPKGARLRFGAPVELPDELELLLASEGRFLPIRVAWRRGREVGVEFESEMS